MEPLALGNPRALPQQSVVALTNIDDVESYIRFIEGETKKTYLGVFDLDINYRVAALQSLSLMGITPGSLFPGIQGLCQQYRDRHFGFRN